MKPFRPYLTPVRQRNIVLLQNIILLTKFIVTRSTSDEQSACCLQCVRIRKLQHLMTDASIPSDARWIPQGMTVEYLAKAKSDVRAITDGSQVDWTTSGEKVVPVDIFDSQDQKVFTARITMNVKV